MKIRGKVTPAFIEATQKSCQSPPPGIKYHSVFSTFGQYDFVITFEALDEKESLKWAILWAEFCDIQTMAAVTYKEAVKLLE